MSEMHMSTPGMNTPRMSTNRQDGQPTGNGAGADVSVGLGADGTMTLWFGDADPARLHTVPPEGSRRFALDQDGAAWRILQGDDQGGQQEIARYEEAERARAALSRIAAVLTGQGQTQGMAPQPSPVPAGHAAGAPQPAAAGSDRAGWMMLVGGVFGLIMVALLAVVAWSSWQMSQAGARMAETTHRMYLYTALTNIGGGFTPGDMQDLVEAGLLPREPGDRLTAAQLQGLRARGYYAGPIPGEENPAGAQQGGTAPSRAAPPNAAATPQQGNGTARQRPPRRDSFGLSRETPARSTE